MTIVERVLLLQRVDIFGAVTTEQLSYIATIAKEMTAPAGKLLYRENDAPDGLYVVISGTIAASRGGEVVDRIRTDGYFGVWALFDDRLRVTNAEAEEDSRLLFVPREQFYEVLSNHVDIVQGLFKQLVQRLHELATIVEK